VGEHWNAVKKRDNGLTSGLWREVRKGGKIS